MQLVLAFGESPIGMKWRSPLWLLSILAAFNLALQSRSHFAVNFNLTLIVKRSCPGQSNVCERVQTISLGHEGPASSLLFRGLAETRPFQCLPLGE